MKILIDFPEHSCIASLEWIQIQHFAESIARSPQHQLVLLIPESDAQNRKHFNHLDSSTVVPLKSNSWLRKRINEKWILPRLVKKTKSKLFISTSHHLTTSLKIQQVLLLDQLKYLRNASYRKMIARCGRLIVPNQYWYDFLRKNHPSIDIKIILPNVTADMSAENSEAIATFKNEYSKELDYFLVHSTDMDADTLTRLLKAYSIFKKFQQSGIQMLLSLPAKTILGFQPLFNSYKYKDDIHFLSDIGEATLKTAITGAYAFLAVDREPVITLPMLLSLAAGVPMILPLNECLQSSWKEEALFAENTDKGWATPLMLLYKDEALKKQLSEQSRLKAALMKESSFEIDKLV